MLLGACADEPEYSQALNPEQTNALELRVEERWQARIAHEWGAAWEYSSPAYREEAKIQSESNPHVIRGLENRELICESDPKAEYGHLSSVGFYDDFELINELKR